MVWFLSIFIFLGSVLGRCLCLVCIGEVELFDIDYFDVGIGRYGEFIVILLEKLNK